MNERKITEYQIDLFRRHLIHEEKSAATVDKYVRDVRTFMTYTEKRNVTKEVTIEYKKHLQEENYAVRSINSMLASLNSFFIYMGWSDCKVNP